MICCVVSMIGDFYKTKWPWADPDPYDWTPSHTFTAGWPVTREEFENLKREVEDMKALLKAAKIYDEKNGEPDCEIDEKMEVLRRVAKMVGVDLEDVLKGS